MTLYWFRFNHQFEFDVTLVYVHNENLGIKFDLLLDCNLNIYNYFQREISF